MMSFPKLYIKCRIPVGYALSLPSIPSRRKLHMRVQDFECCFFSNIEVPGLMNYNPSAANVL